MPTDDLLAAASARLESAQRSFADKDDVKSLDELIAALDARAELTPRDGAEHGMLIMDEAMMLGERWARTRDDATWQRGVGLIDKWTSTVPHSDWRWELYELARGLMLYRRADVTEDDGDVSAAIDALEAARDKVKIGSGVHGTASAHLADLRVRRFESGREPVDLEAAVQDGLAVVTSERARPHEKYFSAQVLARAFLFRFDECGNVANLDAAIDCARFGLELASDEAAIGDTLGLLARALRGRFVRRQDRADLDAAIEAYRGSLERAGDDPTLRAARLDNLGNALSDRFDLTHEAADRSEAVECSRSALKLLPADAPQRVRVLGNLGISLVDLAADSGSAAALDEAIELFHEGLRRAPDTGDLAIRLRLGLASAFLIADAIGRSQYEEENALDTAVSMLRDAMDEALRANIVRPVSYRLGRFGANAMTTRRLLAALLRRAEQTSDRAKAEHDRRLAFAIGEASKVPLLAEEAVRRTLSPPDDISPGLIAWEAQLLAQLSTLTVHELAPAPGTTSTRYLHRIAKRARIVRELETAWAEMASLSSAAASYVAVRQSPSLMTLELLKDGPTGPMVSLLEVEHTTSQGRYRRGIAALLWRPGSAGPDLLFDVDHDPFPAAAAMLATQVPDDRGRQTEPETWWQPIAPLFAGVPTAPHRPTIISPTETAAALPWALLLERARPPSITAPTASVSTTPGVSDAGGATVPPAVVVLPSMVIAVLPPPKPATTWHEVTNAAQELGIDETDQDVMDSVALSIPVSTVPTRPPLVVGDPTENLNAASAEAQAVAAVLGVEPLIGPAASTSAVLRGLTGARLLHIAAHASFDSTEPLDSAIHLADGALPVHRVLGTWSSADLVVLSACEGASGAQIGGGEVLGMATAFLRAGVDTVVAGLWQVDDAASGYLMSAFHEQTAAGLSPAVALARAQALTRAEPGWDPPYYWAAFVVADRGAGRQQSDAASRDVAPVVQLDQT